MKKSLRQRMKEQAPHLIALEESRAYISQIGGVLQMLHEQQIVYRNLKPENIFLIEDGKIVLSGPGFMTPALISATNKDANTTIYRAPEQVLGIASKKSDQYALGCIAYELLTGATPSFDEKEAQTGSNMSPSVALPSRVNPALPVQVDAVLLKTLAEDPSGRYDSTEQFLQAFNEALTLSPLHDAISMDATIATSSVQMRRRAAISSSALFRRGKGPLYSQPVVFLLALLVLIVLLTLGLAPLLKGRQAVVSPRATPIPGIVIARNLLGTPVTSVSGVPPLPTQIGTRVPVASTPTHAPVSPTATTPAQSPKPAAAQLLATAVQSPTLVNLTGEGTMDWVQWGKAETGDFMTRKSGVVPQISGYTLLGNSGVDNFGNNPIVFGWTDGTPIAVYKHVTFGIATYNNGGGFQLSVPAGTTTRTLRVYAGINAATCNVTVTLSGNNPLSYTDTSLSSPTYTPSDGVYTITFRAETNNQTLTVSLVEMGATSAGVISLQAATLQ